MDYTSMIGQSFNRLTVVSIVNGNQCISVCVCGKSKQLNVCHIKSGRVKSCGCLHKDNLITRNSTHNLSRHPLHTIWTNMKSRCYNHKNDRYSRYGGRGITVCNEWLNNFKVFYDWAIANGWEDGLSIERNEIDKNYNEYNCKWIPINDQQKNTSRSRFITFNNKTMTITDWAKEVGVKTQTLFARINIYGWSIEKSLTK